MEAYKQMTKDVCRDNPHEVKMAQLLYIQYVLNEKQIKYNRKSNTGRGESSGGTN